LKTKFDWILDNTDKLTILRPFRDGYEKLRVWVTGNPFNREDWKGRLRDYIGELNQIISEKVVEDVTRDFLTAYFKAIAKQIKAAKEKMHQEFESRLVAMEEELKKTQEERIEIAKRAKTIRKNVIAPFRERVETFIEETEAALPDPDQP
jgi:hypothetical protein